MAGVVDNSLKQLLFNYMPGIVHLMPLVTIIFNSKIETIPILFRSGCWLLKKPLFPPDKKHFRLAKPAKG
jgi:hypothetical protein